MNILSHLYVLPVTGPSEGRGRVCYVCQLGSAPVVAGFIRPDAAGRDKHILEVQRLYDQHPALQAFVVVLGKWDEELTRQLRELAAQHNLTVPLTVLDSEVGLPDAIPVDPTAEATLLLYRGRHVEKIFEVSTGAQAKMMDFTSGKVTQVEIPAEKAVAKAAFGALGEIPGAESSSAFRVMDEAAAEMISRH